MRIMKYHAYVEWSGLAATNLINFRQMLAISGEAVKHLHFSCVFVVFPTRVIHLMKAVALLRAHSII